MLEVNLKIMPQIWPQMHFQLYTHRDLRDHAFMALLLLMSVFMICLAPMVAIGNVLADWAVVWLWCGMLAAVRTLN